MKLKLGAAVVIGLAVAMGVYYKWPNPRDSGVGNTAPLVLSPLALSVVQPEASAAVTVPPVATAKQVSNAAEFDRLARTGKPTDAYRAWQLAANCEAATKWKERAQQSVYSSQMGDSIAAMPTREAACGDLSPGQIASRQQYIVTAAKAGVHGALTSLVTYEGPYGLLHTYGKDDPEWAALERDAVEASIATADPGALLMRASSKTCAEKDISLCKPNPDSLRDWVAAETSRALDEGRPPPKFDPNRYAKTLSLEVAKKAIADGQTIVAARRQP